MKKEIKRLLSFFCAAALICSMAMLSGCGGQSDTPAQTNAPSGTEQTAAPNPAEPGDSTGDNTGDNTTGGTPAQGIQSTFDAYPDSKDDILACVKTHDTETATYKFEAECTDLRGKAGPGWSGQAAGPSMATGIADGAASEGCISYLFSTGLTVNFLVVSDRDVEDAELTFCLGAEHMDTVIDSDLFTVRVDDVSQDDLHPATEDGAIGAWDLAFLAYHKTPKAIISTFECPADSVVKSKDANGPSNFDEFLITTHLKLSEGVNSISIIVTGKELDADINGKTTMECQAPCIDYMKITTSAQLGFFGQQDNNFGTDGLTIV